MAERFGEYELIKKIATGGMAEIYLARIGGVEGFSRNVVVKRMLPQLAVRNDFVQMFLDEARLAANLVHPNIVQVFNLGQVDGSYFMAMELIDGPHLGTLFAHSLRQRRPLPLELCAFVVARAADGLHYAHDERDAATGQPLAIVHRDISPQNILVSRHGDVKVTDFGVAKAETQQSKTRTGIIKGKVSYMSPEQCLGEPVDRRTDVFALGVVLYELLTRRRLYREKSDLLIMQRITSENAKPPSALNPAIDNELDRIAVRALAKGRDERFSSAADLSEALDIWLATQGHADCRAQLQRWMEAHADGLVIGLGSTLEQEGPPSWDRSSSRPVHSAPLEEDEGTVSTPALDPAQGSLRGRHPVVGDDDPDASTSRVSTLGGSLTGMAGGVPSMPGPSDTLLLPSPGSLDIGQAAGAELPSPRHRSKAPLVAALGGLVVALGAIALGVALQGPDDTEEVAAEAAEEGEDPAVDLAVAEVASEPKAAEAGERAADAALAKQDGEEAAEEPPRSLAVLTVETVPSEVLVVVDGVPRGRSPARVELELDGPKQLEVQAVFKDQSPATRAVRLTPKGETNVRLLAKVPLAVRSEPAGAQVFLGSESVGNTPRESLLVEPGKRVVVAVIRPGYKKFSTEVKPESGKPLVVEAKLEKVVSRTPEREPRAPAQPVSYGTLVVDSKPWGVVYVDGRKVGPTPVTVDRVRAGSRKVRIVNRGGDFNFTKTVSVDVKKDARTTVGFVWQKNGENYELVRLVQ